MRIVVPSFLPKAFMLLCLLALTSCGTHDSGLMGRWQQIGVAHFVDDDIFIHTEPVRILEFSTNWSFTDSLQNSTGTWSTSDDEISMVTMQYNKTFYNLVLTDSNGNSRKFLYIIKQGQLFMIDVATSDEGVYQEVFKKIDS